jgi:DNA-binding PadR family transcriptional regulator
MKSNEEPKFLLILLGFSNYRAPLTDKRFDNFQGKRPLCKALAERSWVDYTKEITTVKLLPAGKALLKLETSQLPINALSLNILEKIARQPGKVKVTELWQLKPAERQPVLQGLSDQGLIEIEQALASRKAEVWLTEQGLTYLREDYHPQGNRPVISLDLLHNYLQFLRYPQSAIQALPQPESYVPMSDVEILQAVKALDKELGTENYLPLFKLRNYLSLSREALDQAIFRLQRSDQIELSSLQEVSAYTAEQIDAGIPQNIGGPLFFITTVES